MPAISRQIKMVMYADDTTFYCNLGDFSEDIINNELLKKLLACWTIMEIKRPISDDCVTDAV